MHYMLEIPEDLDIEIKRFTEALRAKNLDLHAKATSEHAQAVKRMAMTGVATPDALRPNPVLSKHVTAKALIWYLLRTGLKHATLPAADEACRAAKVRRGRPPLHEK